MKVALVSEWLDAWRGGAETSTLQFLHHLIDAGVKVHVYTRSRLASTPAMEVHTVRAPSVPRSAGALAFARRVTALLRQQSFDVVHGVSPCRGLDIYQPRGGTVAESIERNIALRGPRLVRSLKRYANRFNLKQRHALSLERALLGGADGPCVVAISQYVVRQLENHYHLSPSRIRLIYNAVDIPLIDAAARAQVRERIRRELNVDDAHCLVLSIAHNFRLKGVHNWMEALAALRIQGVEDLRALVVGKGDGKWWHQRAQKLGIADRLTFLGPSDRVLGLYAAADVLVHPTWYDPCSRVVLEAMTHGLPCVSSRWDGAAEMIEEGVSGFVLDDPADVSALADRVNRLREAPLRQKMGAAALRVRQQVSMVRHTAEMLALYQEIGQRRRLVAAGS